MVVGLAGLLVVGVVGILIVVAWVVGDGGVVVVWLMRLLKVANNVFLVVGGVGLLVVRNNGVVAVSCGCWGDMVDYGLGQ